MQSFRNPVPVAVVLVPLFRQQQGVGLLALRRGVAPALGELALPGGYINWGESWQEAACREVLEETGLALEPEELLLLDAVSVSEGILVLFARSAPREWEQLDLGFTSSETQQLLLLEGPQELAFPSHTQAVANFFAGAG